MTVRTQERENEETAIWDDEGVGIVGVVLREKWVLAKLRSEDSTTVEEKFVPPVTLETFLTGFKVQTGDHVELTQERDPSVGSMTPALREELNRRLLNTQLSTYQRRDGEMRISDKKGAGVIVKDNLVVNRIHPSSVRNPLVTFAAPAGEYPMTLEKFIRTQAESVSPTLLAELERLVALETDAAHRIRVRTENSERAGPRSLY